MEVHLPLPNLRRFESPFLILPNDTQIAFNVTSLDVIHSFWAYQLEVKADANPLENNVAFTKTEQLGSFEVRCSELCGIWHGAMFNSGKVVSQSAFMNWATSTETKNAQNTKDLPRSRGPTCPTPTVRRVAITPTAM